MGIAVLCIVVTFVVVTLVALAVLVVVYRREARTGRVVLLGGVAWRPSDSDIELAIAETAEDHQKSAVHTSDGADCAENDPGLTRN